MKPTDFDIPGYQTPEHPELLAALLAELAKHQHERGALENPLECLRRIVRERDQAMGAAVIVPALLGTSQWRHVGMRTCEYCGKQTRETTAGCDHCDVEDK